jgi:hypothetical protein
MATDSGNLLAMPTVMPEPHEDPFPARPVVVDKDAPPPMSTLPDSLRPHGKHEAVEDDAVKDE